MSLDNLTPDEMEMLQERGAISELEFYEWELEGLSAAKRMSMEKRRLFLRAFALRGLVIDGVTAAGVSRSAVMAWRESEWFETLYQAALDEAADRIEAEAFRRAVTGYDEPVVYKGQFTKTIDPETGEERILSTRKYSDSLMAMMLKGARPEKYRENHSVDHNIAAGGVLVVPAPVDPDSWAKAAKAQQAKYAGNNEGAEE